MFAKIKAILSLAALFTELVKAVKYLIIELDKYIWKKRREKKTDEAIEKAKTSGDTSDLESLLR